MTAVQGVASDWQKRVAAEFFRCRRWIEAALKASPLPTHTMDDVWSGLMAGTLELYSMPHSVCIVEVKDYPTGVRVMHGLMAGGEIGSKTALAEVQDTVAWLEAYARERGCHFAAPQGRRGWLRALNGYREAYTVMSKDLR